MTQKPIFKHIGFNHMVQVNRVVAIIPPGTATSTNYLKRAREAGLFIDATLGRRFRSILILEDGFVVASAISTATLLKRFSEEYDGDYTDQAMIDQDMEDMVFEMQEDIDE